MAQVKKVGRLKNADTKYLGQEPTEVNTDLDYILALNWYNYFYDVKNAKKWLVEYCKHNDISLTNVKEINMTMCSIARMLNRGLNIAESSQQYLANKLADQIEPVRNVRHVKVAASKFPLDLFEEELDMFYTDNYKFFSPSTYTILSDLKARPIDAKSVVEYYTPLLDELRENPEDYSYLGKRKLSAYVKFVNAMIEDASTYASNKRAKTIRKPRKKKALNPAKLVANVKYLKECTDLKIVSVPPQKIIGASVVWLYNTKYKKVTKVEADTHHTLTVKGTTIQNFSPEKTVSKIVRKPAEFLTKLLHTTALRKHKLFAELKTKQSVGNGRLSEHTIILGIK